MTAATMARAQCAMAQAIAQVIILLMSRGTNLGRLWRRARRAHVPPIDPADPAHFTVPYTVNGTPGVIDATLKDDDSIDLKIRPGSADVISVWNAARKDTAPK